MGARTCLERTAAAYNHVRILRMEPVPLQGPCAQSPIWAFWVAEGRERAFRSPETLHTGGATAALTGAAPDTRDPFFSTLLTAAVFDQRQAGCQQAPYGARLKMPTVAAVPSLSGC